MMHHWDGGWGVGNWLLMGFGMLLFWAVVVAGIVWLVHWTSAGRTAQTVSPSRTTALDILDQRYARGEIGDEEYRTRRETLTAR
jgi:putative membrane protein